MNYYEAKQEAKRERLEAAADRAEQRSNAAYGRADLRESASGIPLGQPILVGHHSEGRHRAAIKRADNAMRKSVEEGKRAGELRARAAAVGSGGISSDDPEAVTKLKEKLAELEKAQAKMKAANRVIRKWVKKGVTHETQGESFDAYAADMIAIHSTFGPIVSRSLIEPQYGRLYGFQSYQLTNNNAKIKLTKDRIAQLEQQAGREDVKIEYQGVCTYFENTEANRVQLLFDGKPSADTRSILKANGFRWAPSEKAWQRQLNGNGRYAAKIALKGMGVEA